MTITVTPIPNLTDNYVWHLRDETTERVAIVDPAEADKVADAVDRMGGRLDMILLTHHHIDHIGGAEALRARFRCPIIGAAADAYRLPALDMALGDGDVVELGVSVARVIAVPGHTLGHIAYFFEDDPLVACGDTLFSLGCGRLFEGTPEQMFTSLAKLAALPAATRVCCGHEYTESNLRFAEHVDGANPALPPVAAHIRARRAEGAPTLPSLMGDETRTNPFLRAPDAGAFATLRTAKDNFR